MKFDVFKGFEDHLENYELLAHGTPEQIAFAGARQQKMLKGQPITDVSFEDIYIDRPEAPKSLRLRICRPNSAEGTLPIVLDIHGGGFVAGSPEIDDFRNSLLAKGIPAIVVSVEYRLASEDCKFPIPLLDCYEALKWLSKYGDTIGGDKTNIGIHGTSAGGALAGGVTLYARDNDGPKIKLCALVNPELTGVKTISTYQNDRFALEDYSDWNNTILRKYLGNLNGSQPSYYAYPAYCPVLYGLPPMVVIGAEYDPLRDDAVRFANRLYDEGVPCELIVAPRVGHGFATVDTELTDWVMQGICMAYRMEFEKK